jgi:DNA helicase-2/ATP-dependent DNA helicase PcrA
METERGWSNFQQAIFRDVAEGEGHTVVLARAGSGKTSTIMQAITMIPPGLTTLVCAFNKSIEKELAARVQKAGLSVEVKTLHAFGFRALGRAFRPQLNEHKVRDILEKLVPGDDKRERRDEMRKCISLCKGNLVERDDLDAVDGVCIDYGIDSGDDPKDRIAFCKIVLDAMDRCARDTKTVDFDDMVWLPVVLGLNVWQFDRVFVDETQDLNAAQIELMLMACAEGGRICVVGDDRQAIYGFRGADSSAIPNLIRRLDAKTLPLSVTYRCARKIVDIAAQIVPDFEAAPNAKDGEVAEASELDIAEKARPGDFVLSRTNAPLVKHCLALLARGTAAAIQGRDVSAQLLKVVKKSKAKTIPDLAGWLREWRVRECDRLLRKDPEADTTRITDVADCIDALCEGETSIASVTAKIQALFSDTDETRRVTLSTTHKAKGLERDRAWVLADTYRPTRGTEEANLWYVAVTRAKTTLFLVRGEEKKKDRDM